MYFAYLDLKRKIKFPLPNCWYRYGNEVVIACMPWSLNWTHETATQTIIEWSGPKPRIEDEEIEKILNDKFEELILKYKDDFKKLIDDCYDYAPYEFQRKFLDLRWHFQDMKNTPFNWDAPVLAKVSKSIFKDLFSNFPSKSFPSLSKQKIIVEDLIYALIEQEDPDYNFIQDIFNNFWFLFCYHLRIKKDAYENVPNSIMSLWREKLSLERTKYRRILADQILESIDKYSIEMTDILAEEVTWKKQEDIVAEELFDRFQYDLMEAKKFFLKHKEK